MLVRVFYVSEISPPISETDVQVILGIAQVRNRRLDVTGMLAQSDGHFAQVLEGRREAVDDVLQRIWRDQRHRNQRIVLDEEISIRQFPRWAMGLVRRDDMAEEMERLFNEGCENAEAARAVITRLLQTPN